MSRFVPWNEAVLVAAVCWTVCGLGYGVLAVLDEPHVPVAPLIGIGLVRWFFERHRFWPAAFAAGPAGAVTLFGLVDVLRPTLNHYVADALATGVAVSVALTVFTLVGRGGT
ncbi:hypothetical protein ACFP51_00765 [Streptomyces pratens]|uniref:Integral membrane protein n=1 Tax=Streptomyces pratens TaxID=887456 RepID=A0ABW1LUK2_9ACTN